MTVYITPLWGHIASPAVAVPNHSQKNARVKFNTTKNETDIVTETAKSNDRVARELEYPEIGRGFYPADTI